MPTSRREAVYRIGLETNLGARTIGDYLDGKPVRPATRTAIVGAVKRLRIELPAEAPQVSAAERVSPQSSDPAPPTAPHVERAERATHASNTRSQASDAHGAPRKRKRTGAGARARSDAKFAARVAARNGQVSA